MFDAIVIGSGPAGVFTAYGLESRDILMLDTGHEPPAHPPLEGNLYELRRRAPDLFDWLIGQRFEGLHNVHQRANSLKLKAPYMSYIIKDWERLSPVVSESFDAVASFALGGLANAWGAGVYRFSDADLAGFPVSAAELGPFYDALTAHIGVSGTNDDLARFFGADGVLQPPLRLSQFATRMLEDYARSQPFFERSGIYLGRPRLAVLTRPHDGRPSYACDNLEFFEPRNPAIYNPVFTLEQLINKGAVQYARPYLALRYAELQDRIQVIARNLESGGEERFEARRLFLAAGTLNTTKIVLRSANDCETRLPLLDNPMSCLPLFRLDQIGLPLDIHDSSLAQLNLVYHYGETGVTLQGTIYGATGPMRSDVIFDLPLTIGANLQWTKYLAPAMGLLMLFYPAMPRAENYIRLRPEGELEIHYQVPTLGRAEGALAAKLLRAGCVSSARLCKYPKMGSSIHYAGTLPMKHHPAKYQTDAEGRLAGSCRVYVTDGACFTHLPAKNLTFTIMANAMRIARCAGKDRA